MTAMAAILPTGTTIQQAVVESALDMLSGAWPGILISCPETREERAATGRKREVHTVVVLYLDPWDSAARTVAQLATDARVALEQMKANVRANHTLTVAGTAYALAAGETINTTRLGILQEIDEQKLPLPMYAALMTFEEIKDLWFSG
jgi:hypothetical protein